ISLLNCSFLLQLGAFHLNFITFSLRDFSLDGLKSGTETKHICDLKESEFICTFGTGNRSSFPEVMIGYECDRNLAITHPKSSVHIMIGKTTNERQDFGLFLLGYG